MTTMTVCDWCGAKKAREEWGTVQMFRKASYACLKDLCPRCYMELWDYITKRPSTAFPRAATATEVLIGGIDETS